MKASFVFVNFCLSCCVSLILTLQILSAVTFVLLFGLNILGMSQ